MRRRSMEMIILMAFFSLIKFSYQENCVEEATGFYGNDVMINCSFDPSTVRIRWTYNDEEKILVEYADDEKSGIGYENGEYDMERNGSLVIKDVNFTHEGNYRVLIIWGSDFKHNESDVKFSVTEHCPPDQTGYLGKDAIIVCHFKPNFKEVRWFSDTSVDKPLIKWEGSEMPCPSFENFIITSNGSLIIRTVSEENRGNYTVILTVPNKTSRHNVIFAAGFDEQTSTTHSHPNTSRDQSDAKDTCWNDLSPPENGHINNIRKTIILGEISCKEGFHIAGDNQLKCEYDDKTNSYRQSDPTPALCISGAVNTLQPVTTTMTKRTNHYSSTYSPSRCECSVNENCKTMRIAIIIESISLVVIVIVMTTYCIKRNPIKCSNQNNTPSDGHQPTEGDNMLNREQEQGETST